MKQEKVYATPNRITPHRPLIFNPKVCTGCNRCVDICDGDVLIPNPEKRKPPFVLFPDECWYCGCCVDECPEVEAVTLNHPLTQRVRWKRKKTGEHFRI
ncbi:MAG: ferredoxin family protein [Deltaproteobacteria bacterium]|nr:ferredoxin family protein [Deltaproteobacteria bacterium]